MNHTKAKSSSSPEAEGKCIDLKLAVYYSCTYTSSAGLWTMRLSMKHQQADLGENNIGEGEVEVEAVARQWLFACHHQLDSEDSKKFPQEQGTSKINIEASLGEVYRDSENGSSEVMFRYTLHNHTFDGAEATVRLDDKNRFLGATVTKPSSNSCFIVERDALPTKSSETKIAEDTVLDVAREIANYEKDDPIVQQWRSGLITSWYFDKRSNETGAWRFSYTVPGIFKKSRAKNFKEFGFPGSQFVDYVITPSGVVIDEIPRDHHGSIFPD